MISLLVSSVSPQCLFLLSFFLLFSVGLAIYSYLSLLLDLLPVFSPPFLCSIDSLFDTVTLASPPSFSVALSVRVYVCQTVVSLFLFQISQSLSICSSVSLFLSLSLSHTNTHTHTLFFCFCFTVHVSLYACTHP